MEELLKVLYHNELNLSKEDEKEATKELSAEYSRAYERCADSMGPENMERLNILLDIAGDIEAVRDEHRFIRYAIFGAQLQRELMGDASSSGSVPLCQSFNEARLFQKLIHTDSEAYKRTSEKAESLADELIDTYPEIKEKLDEYLTAVCQQYTIHKEDVFDYAFKLGARIILKILGDDRTL